uniref:Uncharacterized protein n=1 Tax=Magallana gigas TaxID=29159 RepID=A0A8W8KFG6_MAGGI
MDIWLKVFIAFVVIQNVQTQSRPVVNTTCLELAKPSNQQYRLICSHYDYHCLLDKSYTQEFEVCREWKWIPGGKCAYFNTYGSGNVDESQCEPGINLTCSERISQFRSNSNIQFTACYAKRDSSTSLSTSTSPALVTSSNVTSNGDNSKSSVTSKAWIISLFTVIAVFLSIAAILFIRRCMDKPLCKIECQESRILAMNKDTSEKQSFLRNETEDNSESPPTMSHQDETITGGRKSEDTDAGQKEKSAKTASSSRFDSVTSDNEEEKDKKESTGVFDDTFESLQRKAPLTGGYIAEYQLNLCHSDAKGHEELYSLLNDGTLTKKVMAAVIKKMTRKTSKELSDDENVQNKVQNLLDEGKAHIPHMNEFEWEDSIHVLYALHRIVLDEKYHPKSGWGNPVKDEDIGKHITHQYFGLTQKQFNVRGLLLKKGR